MSIVKFTTSDRGTTRKASTRYKPSVLRDGYVVFTAEQNRQHDIERLVERVPQRLLDRLISATADELWVLLAFAEGLHSLQLRNRDLEVDGFVLEGDDDFNAVTAATPAVFKQPRRARENNRSALRVNIEKRSRPKKGRR